MSDGAAGNEQLTALTGTVLLRFGAMTLHVLTYAWRLPRILLSTRDNRGRPARSGMRLMLVAASIGAGLILALLAMRLAAGWTTWAPRW